MGKITDEELRSELDESAAVSAHIATNLYPSPGAAWSECGLKAIEAIKDGEPDRRVELPQLTGCYLARERGGSSFYTKDAPAWRVVEGLRLEAFVEEGSR